MTAITRNPTNPNPLIGSRFILSFGRVPNVQYFCQSVSVPGISLSEAVIVNPFVDIYSPGEKAIYDLLNVTFMVDEDLTAWKEIHEKSSHNFQMPLLIYCHLQTMYLTDLSFIRYSQHQYLPL